MFLLSPAEQGRNKVRIKLSDLLTQYEYDDLHVIYCKNGDGTYTFYLGYIWNVQSSYRNPTPDDIKYCSKGFAVRFTCNPEIFDIVSGGDGNAQRVLNGVDISQFIWKNGFREIMLFDLICKVQDDILVLWMDAIDDMYAVKDCMLDIEVLDGDELDNLYDEVYKDNGVPADNTR